jgi:DNA (cytosine-5)-methyltransferase 1
LFKYVDLFAGCGGLSLGIERAGGSLQLAVEKSQMAARTFFVNFLDDSITDEEWTSHTESSVESQAAQGIAVRALRDVLDSESAMQAIVSKGIDVVVGGPPCQGFSLAGRRNPHDVRNTLPWEYLEFVGQTKPKFVVIENVVGMNHKFSKGEDSAFIQLQQALRETVPGYEVQGVAVNALHFGAPQNRPRLMIIGLRSDIAKSKGITSTGQLWTSTFLDEAIAQEAPALAPIPTVARADSPTVADAIGDLQSALPVQHTLRAQSFKAAIGSRHRFLSSEFGEVIASDIPNQTLRRHSGTTQERFRLYQWFRDNDLKPRLLAQISGIGEVERDALLRSVSSAEFPAISPDGTLLAENANELMALMLKLSTRKHSQKALAWDKPARTVVTLPDDYVHPSEPRIFTVREMARFQGFPDDFIFVGKETTGSMRRRFEVPQYSQVGNAVSPLLAHAVGRMIAQVLADNDSVDPMGGNDAVRADCPLSRDLHDTRAVAN